MLERLTALARRARRRVALGRRKAPVPFAGWAEGRVYTPVVDRLSSADLQRLNRLLDWQCFTVDQQGRRFGDAAWSGKRTEPSVVPDRRIALMDERFGLAGRRVLEIGCFEGVHTIGLARLGAEVVATDGRIENVVKTAVRCAFFGVHASVDVWDVESDRSRSTDFECDLVHHVGVLYHLADPVSHLRDIAAITSQGLMLDTHVADEATATETYEVAGEVHRYRRYGEFGREDPFSGMRDHAKWLPLENLTRILKEGGFDQIEVVEHRNERNGPRVLLFAEKGASS